MTSLLARRTLLAWVAAGALALIAAPGFAQSGVAFPAKAAPDFLQTLGVGSRAVGMGGAFSAIADDATATFWNPARLPVVGQGGPQFMVEYRSAYRATAKRFGGDPNLGITLGSGPKPMQPTFASFVYPLHRGKHGTLGIAYTLGGYFDLDFSETLAQGSIQQDTLHRFVMRNSYVTVAWGQQFGPVFTSKGKDGKGGEREGTVGVGVGYYRLTNDQYRSTDTLITDSSDGSFVRTSDVGIDKGHGDGYMIAAAYTSGHVASDKEAEGEAPVSNGTWQFGLTYRSGTRLNGLSDIGRGFGDEVPARLSYGAAYTRAMPDASTLVVSAEGQTFGKANSVDQTDYRRSITNWHIGAELTPSRGWIRLPFVKLPAHEAPIRIGFHTNSSAATNYTYDDNVISLGVAYRQQERHGYRMTIEPTVEFLTRNGAVLYTLTVNFFPAISRGK